MLALHLATRIVTVTGIVVGGLCALNTLIFFIPQVWWPADRGGDRRRGLVIWVEPLRFLNIRWGKTSAAAGLRRAGYAGEFLYWEWHSGLAGTLLLPALRNRRRIEREAKKLADFIAARRAEVPSIPIYLMGYSAGGFVAMRALELLPEGVQVDSAAALAAAFSPWRDLRPAAAHVRGPLLVASSAGDWWVCGFATLLSGNADGVHSPAIGMLGYHGPPAANIVQRRWRPAMLRDGLAGMHDWALLPGFLARYAVKDMGLSIDGNMVQDA